MLKINICDFWESGNQPETNFFIDFLSRHFDLEISDDPDVIIYSCFGKKFLDYKCTRIYYSPENIRPNFNECDYALTFDHSEDPRHFRLPLYILSVMDTSKDLSPLIRKNRDLDEIFNQKTQFCSFIYSNSKPRYRKDFFKKLSNYKSIDAPGKLFNNTDELNKLDKVFSNEQHSWRKAKTAFLRKRKFDISFENESFPGYQTEKIIDSFLTDTIPIYWGNPLVTKHFNPKAFINAHDFNDLDELTEYVKEIDNNTMLYKDMLNEPIFKGNEVPEELTLEALEIWFSKVFRLDHAPIAATSNQYNHLKSYFYHNYGKYAEKAYNRVIGRTKNFA